MSPYTATLPRASESVRAARRLVEIHSDGLSAARREDAGLMVSELVTNALLHGRGKITIDITASADALTVEVCDEGSGTVAIARSPGAAGGWGLRVIDELSDAWGARDGSTRVWFRLGLDPR